MMAIDWSLARTPNFFELYQDSFERGRALALQRMNEGATGSEKVAPAPTDITDGDEDDPYRLLQELKGQERAAAHNHAEVLVSMLHGLSTIQDQRERLSAARHLARQMPQFGIQPDSLTADHLTGEAIAREIARLNAFLQPRTQVAAPASPDGWPRR